MEFKNRYIVIIIIINFCWRLILLIYIRNNKNLPERVYKEFDAKVAHL